MRTRIVAGNWKMNTTKATGVALAEAVVKATLPSEKVKVVVCPPTPYLAAISAAVAGSPVTVGAQNCSDQDKGAFTGETAAPMLADVGCSWVILGHSERRHGLGESDAFINAKIGRAHAAGLKAIFCLGETLDERKSGKFDEVILRQLTGGLAGLDAASLAKVVIAYEPVWAIGTGVTASPAEAQAAHAFIRAWLAKTFGDGPAAATTILYGGSVDKSKAPDLFAQPDIDGGLVGGASLKPDDFAGIIAAAMSAAG